MNATELRCKRLILFRSVLLEKWPSLSLKNLLRNAKICSAMALDGCDFYLFECAVRASRQLPWVEMDAEWPKWRGHQYKRSDQPCLESWTFICFRPKQKFNLRGLWRELMNDALDETRGTHDGLNFPPLMFTMKLFRYRLIKLHLFPKTSSCFYSVRCRLEIVPYGDACAGGPIRTKLLAKRFVLIGGPRAVSPYGCVIRHYGGRSK